MARKGCYPWHGLKPSHSDPKEPRPSFFIARKGKKSNPNRRTAAQARGQRLMIGDRRSTKDFWTGPASVKIQARRTAGGGLIQMRPFLALT